MNSSFVFFAQGPIRQSVSSTVRLGALWHAFLVVLTLIVIPLGLTGCAEFSQNDTPHPRASSQDPQPAPPATPQEILKFQKVSDKLSHLSAWSDKSAFDDVDGKILIDDKDFKEAVRKTVGNKFYKKFMPALHDTTSKVIASPMENKYGLMRSDIEEFSWITASGYDTSIFISPEYGFVDVCWHEFDNTKKYPTESTKMFLHSGKSFSLDNNKCDSYDYKDIMDKKKYYSKISKLQKQLLGTWTGVDVRNEKYGLLQTFKRKIVFSGNSKVPNGLKYIETVFYSLDKNGRYTCTRTNRMSRTEIGTVHFTDEGILLTPDTIKATCKEFRRPSYGHSKLVDGKLLSCDEEWKPLPYGTFHRVK